MFLWSIAPSVTTDLWLFFVTVVSFERKYFCLFWQFYMLCVFNLFELTRIVNLFYLSVFQVFVHIEPELHHLSHICFVLNSRRASSVPQMTKTESCSDTKSRTKACSSYIISWNVVTIQFPHQFSSYSSAALVSR